MAIINLRDFYPWYTQDELIDVSDEIVAELVAGRRYQQTHERTIRRNDVLSLDAQDGIEAAASVHQTDSPERVFEMMDQYCRLCQALNSLPEVQGRRVDAHFLLGMSRKEIAATEGVSVSAVNVSIDKGLRSMKIFLQNYAGGGCFSPDFCPDI